MEIDRNQPLGTPTWISLGVADLPAAQKFYGTVFGWEFTESPDGVDCLLRGVPVAGLGGGPGWTVHLATPDCDATVDRVLAAGGEIVEEPHEVGDRARRAVVIDTVGARLGLWQGRSLPGCRLVNEPNTLIRNDLITADAGAARGFYTEVFDFTLDGNADLPEFDFTFLRRPDGKEIGGILGQATAASAWGTLFEVPDVDATVEKAAGNGGTAGAPEQTPYGRTAVITDPFGTEFSVITRP
ncbi:glyoxalase [Actinophytocola xinjiangensis]|uniref:Glyoxalase n=1 Tax=Actinophytocola xinjiangensis TaxID=485602 RepID=A0A7Z0WL03_9PSEU|nr:VOC family protein [Actinophytocola xinjiangensis]OLF09169.1 glyoxalase [Actinophytocola xinjiangensis]